MFAPSTVLGLDPGIATTGYAAVTRAGSSLRLLDVGVVTTPASDGLPERLCQLHAALTELIARLRPDGVAVERVLFSANARTAMAVGQGSGVALLAAAEAGIPVEQYSPNEVKLAVAGYGGAPDACALAICHLHAGGLRARVKEALR